MMRPFLSYDALLPFLFSMGAVTFFMYLLTGDAMFMGQNVAYASVTVYVVGLMLADFFLRRRKQA